MPASGPPPTSELTAEALAELVGRADPSGIKLARQVLEALARAAPERVPHLAEARAAVPYHLRTAEEAKDDATRAAALHAVAKQAPLGSLTKPQIDSIRGHLRDAKSPEVATAAGWALARGQDRDFLSAQLDVLATDDDREAQRIAAYFIGSGRFLPAEDELIRLLAPGHASVRSAAVWALGELRSSSATPTFLAMIEEGAYVEEVCEALGKIADASAIPALLQVVHAGTTPQVRAATEAIARTLGGAEETMLPAEVGETLARIMAWLVDKSDDVTTGFFGLSVLARMGAPLSPVRIRKVLGAKLADEDVSGVAAFFSSRKPKK